MKKIVISTLLLAASSAVVQAQTLVLRNEGSLTAIAAWDFNGGNSPTVASVNARYNQQFSPYFTAGVAASPGDSDYGTAYFTSAGNVGATFASNRSLASSNAPVYDLLSTDGLLVSNNSLGDVSVNARSLLLSSTTVLDTARAVFLVDSVNALNTFSDLNVAFSARNQGNADATISFSYSLNGGATYVPIAGTTLDIVVSGSAYSVYTANFSSVSALEGVDNLLIGLDYTEDALGASVFLDNLAVYATASAVPEPSTYAALVGALGLGFAAYRRRKQS